MKSLRFSIATVMIAILLMGVDFAAVRHLAWPALEFRPLHLSLSLLPMLNVLIVLGYRFARNPQAREPVTQGFIVFGFAAMLAHFACVTLNQELVKATYIAPIGPLFELCKTYHVPFYVGHSSEGYSYFRYYPALILINFFFPQLLLASFGAYVWQFMTLRSTERRASFNRPSTSKAAS